MGVGTTGRRRAIGWRAPLGLAGTITFTAGCGEPGPIDRDELELEAALPDSTAPELDEDARDEIREGEVHRIALNVHCGVRFLPDIDGRDWEAVHTDTDFSDLELEAIGAVEGELELVATDRLEFRHPKLRVTFRPYEDDGAVGNCD